MSTKMRFVFCLGVVAGMALIAGLAWGISSNVAASSQPNTVQTSASDLAQEVLTGEWTASVDKNDAGKIQLNLERRGEKGRSQMGQSYDFADLQGLSREQALNGGAVKFSLVREAGRIDCEGSFQNGKGSGTFRFTGNQSFVSAMKTRGFDFTEDSSEKGWHRSEDGFSLRLR